LYSISWVAWLFLVVPVGTFSALWLYRKSIEKSLLTVAATFMLTSFIFFAVPFQAMDNQGSVQKLRPQITAHKNVVGYINFNDAFVFYANDRIPLVETPEELQNYLSEHQDALVLSRARDLSYMDSIPNISRIQEVHDLFSRQLSGSYTVK
jgi:hypothetical protein